MGGGGGVSSPRLTREPVAFAMWPSRQSKAPCEYFLRVLRNLSHKACQGQVKGKKLLLFALSATKPEQLKATNPNFAKGFSRDEEGHMKYGSYVK